MFFDETQKFNTRCYYQSDDANGGSPDATNPGSEDSSSADILDQTEEGSSASFGSPVNETSRTMPVRPSALGRYIDPSRNIGKTEKKLQEWKANLAARKATQMATRKVATTAAARTAVAATGAVSSVATAGLSLLVTGALIGIDFYNNHRWFQWVVFVFCSVTLISFITLGLVGLTFLLSMSLPGANHRGGTRYQAPEDNYNVATAAQATGLILGDTLESLTITTTKLEELLNKNPSGAKVAEAKKKLQEIKDYQKTIQGGAFSSNHEEYAKKLTKYKAMIRELFSLIYPGRAGAQKQVQDLIKSKRVIPVTAAGCRPDRDLQGLGVSENLLNVISAAGNTAPVTINCLITGHRKFVNRPPKDGFPRCGDLSNKGAEGTVPTLHCLGRAVDIQYNATIERMLESSRQQLHIRKIIHEHSPEHLHIEVLE